jgi:hypothetical protein
MGREGNQEFIWKKEELKLTHRRWLLFYIRERGQVAAGPYSLCGLRLVANHAVVQNSNLIGKWAVRAIKNLCGKKEELKLTHRRRLLFYIHERGQAAAGPYSLWKLRSSAAKAAVQNSNLIGKWAVRGI